MSERRLITRLGRNLAIALVVGGLTSGARFLNLFEQFRLGLSNTLYRAADRPGEEIVVVAIDEASLDLVGPLPWPYSAYADLLSRLDGASAVGVDALLDTDAPGLDELATVAREMGDVVFVDSNLGSFANPSEATGLYTATSLVESHASLRESAAGVGHVNVLLDVDQSVRRVPLLVRTPDGDTLEALGLQLLRLHLRENELAPPPATFTGQEVVVDPRLWSVRADRGATLWINYTGAPGKFPRVSAADVLSGDVPEDTFDGRIVIVGKGGVLDETDIHNVPVSSTRMDGVEIQANIADTLLRRRELLPQSVSGAIITNFTVALVVGLGVTMLGVSLGALYTVLVGAAYYLVVAGFLFDNQHVIPDLFFPALAAALTYGTDVVVRLNRERRRRQQMELRFSKHVSPQLMELLAASNDPAIVEPIGETREITILFTDIRDFTTITERHAPGDVVHALNEHFDKMVEIVFRQGGYVNKYTGDGLMALYNAPLRQEDFAWKAVQTADWVLEAARELAGKQGPIPVPFEYGIGIATGEVVVGNIGGAGRLEYTAIGDGVNLAARLVGIAERGQILMNERTYQLVADRVEANPLRGIKVKGKTEELTVYELTRLKA